MLLSCQGGLLLEQATLRHFPREDPLICLRGVFLVAITARRASNSCICQREATRPGRCSPALGEQPCPQLPWGKSRAACDPILLILPKPEQALGCILPRLLLIHLLAQTIYL